jgi:hypothetical protein
MHKLICVALLLGAACGGDDGGGSSGVDGTKQLKDLTSAEVMAECEWGVEAQGGAGHTTTCGDNVTVTVDTVAECVTEVNAYKTNCTATVTQLEACTNALAANPCDFTTSACAAIFACAM